MKKMLAWVVLVLVLSTSVALAEDTFTYRTGIQFGMSMDEVKATETIEATDASENAILYADQKVAGENASILYSFEGKPQILTCIFVIFPDVHTNPNDYIDDFSKIDSAITSKYGEGEYNGLYYWKDDLFKDDPDKYGLAIAAGQLIIGSSWVTQGVEISHMLSGDNYEISHNMRYVPENYQAPMNTDGV